MTQKRFDVGTKVRVRAVFRNTDGDRQDPTEVRFGAKTPSGVTTQFEYPPGAADEIVRDGEGEYHFDLLLTEGDNIIPWWVRFDGSGDVEAAGERQIFVKAPNIVFT